MRHYKQTSADYIIAIGTGSNNTEISEVEYNNILTVIRNRPAAEGKGYRLKTDLTWEAYDLPPEPKPSDDDEISDDEALSIITGGAL